MLASSKSPDCPPPHELGSKDGWRLPSPPSGEIIHPRNGVDRRPRRDRRHRVRIVSPPDTWATASGRRPCSTWDTNACIFMRT